MKYDFLDSDYFDRIEHLVSKGLTRTNQLSQKERDDLIGMYFTSPNREEMVINVERENESPIFRELMAGRISPTDFYYETKMRIRESVDLSCIDEDFDDVMSKISIENIENGMFGIKSNTPIDVINEDAIDRRQSVRSAF